ncbi:MAG: hypothetical protein U0Q11_09980 [Vicinamibacterales bacterium]
MPNDAPLNWTTVNQEELRRVRARRRSEQGTEDGPLVGLAFSGGGIRSATFGLGVMETLKSLGVLKAVDYLSTVSGGGYIGSWLTAGCFRERGWLDRKADWSSATAHLRRYSNYLSPSVGFFSADTWSMITIWLRNTTLIQTTVILAVACALLIPRLLFELFCYWPNAGDLRWLSILLFILGIVGIAGNQMRLTGGKGLFLSRILLRKNGWPWGLAGAAVCGAAAYGYAKSIGFDPFHGGEVHYRGALPVAALLVVGGFLLQPVAVRLVSILWVGQEDDRPAEVNYTQNWVQAAVVVPMGIAAFLVTAILWKDAQPVAGATEGLHSFDSYGAFLANGWRYWPFPLSVVFVSFWLLSVWGIRDRRDWKAWLTAMWAPFVGAAAMHAMLSVVMVLLHDWAKTPDNAVQVFVFAPALVALAFVQAVVVLIGMIGRQSTDAVREWWSRLGAWLGIYATAWMVIAMSAVYGPRIMEWIFGGRLATSLTAGGWLATVASGLAAGGSATTKGAPAKSTATQAKEVLAVVAPFVFIAGLLLGVGWVLDVVIRLNAGTSWTSLNSSTPFTPLFRVSGVALAACGAALLLMAWRVDINQFSLNEFYRNRLVRCYLGATRVRNPQNFTGFDDDDDLPLAALAGSETTVPSGPLHIVNCALNLGGSSDLALHTRHSASFSMSPYHCGSAYPSHDQRGALEEIGYIPTESYGGRFGAPTLGQAVSVSGAAASPNMGYHTSSVTAFLLTLFNVRLGWWFPHPRQVGASAASPTFSLRYLLTELFGGANDKSRFLMISDGGHFENLAAYELIRRECDVVIISDGECDPTLSFEGLGTLIRMCEVDFNAKISINVDAIRLRAQEAWSTEHYAVGTISYMKSGKTGTLIYIKASMTGKEDTPILQYKSSHPAFPHESTSNQFYKEDQFESYRHLGQIAACQAFEAATTADPKLIPVLTRA